MARRYCSRCLQTFGPDEEPRRCKRSTCRGPRPQAGWPQFLGLGDVIDDRYDVEEILGAGGAGITYRCSDRRGEGSLAVKVLHGDRRSGVLANRLAIEGEVLELLDHPNIVPFCALNLFADGESYLVTPHMPGGSLDIWLRRHKALPPRAAVALGRQLALALDYVHAGGIVHRDVKPANVLLEDDDPRTLRVRLADFGIARVFRDARPMPSLTRTGAFIGTPEYAAPEQKRGEKGIGPAADAFALGALLHAAAGGGPLHRREDVEDWDEFRFRDWNPELRPRLTDLVPAHGRDLAALNLLDEVIDALMQPDAAARIDLGHAALRLGAHPDELAPQDLPAFSPPSLTSMPDGPGFDDALLPPHAADDGPTLLLPREPSPRDEGKPRLDLPPLGLITRDAASDWDDRDLDWAGRRRRDRRHAALAVAAAILLGAALAWPGGPGALLERVHATDLGAPIQALAQRLRLQPVTVEAEPPPRGRAVGGAERVRRAGLPSLRSGPAPASSPRAKRSSASPPKRASGASPEAAGPERVAQVHRRPAEDQPSAPITEPKRTPAARSHGEVPAFRPSSDTTEPRRTPTARSHGGGEAMAAWSPRAEDRPEHRSVESARPAPSFVPSPFQADGESFDPALDDRAAGPSSPAEPLRRLHADADRRAVTYEEEARRQQARREALLARIDRLNRREQPVQSVAEVEPAEEPPALDPIFAREPRLKPR